MDFSLEIVNIVQNTVKVETFGQVVARKRKALGLTQDQLQLRCGDVLGKSYISQIEKERKLKDGVTLLRPAVDKVDALADALGEPRNYFRRLTGHPLIEDESSRDVAADEFGNALHGYRLLNERSQNFAKSQIRATIDFLLEVETPGTEGSKRHSKEPPGMTLKEVRKVAAGRKQKKPPASGGTKLR